MQRTRTVASPLDLPCEVITHRCVQGLATHELHEMHAAHGAEDT